ncbi:MAG TPA: hypothetical protein VMJ64_13245 [Anaerolineales bacterium]|nr:hypothetical protein [Anaerolineales bacterium]
MKRIRKWVVPLLLAAVTLVAYGLLLPLTGFYWDDWPFAWLARFMGPSDFIPAFRGFRPFLGPIFFVTTSLVPANPLLWQIFALVVRFGAALAAWFALSRIWPAHKRQVLVVCLLFLVYPGYSQHWVALTHINQEWIPLILYLLSFGFTARAIREIRPDINRDQQASGGDSDRDVHPRDLPGNSSVVQNQGRRAYLANTVIALVLLVAGLFPTEYFIGLEPLRFLFIGVIVSEWLGGFWPRIGRSMKYWWPYLLVWLADAAWLVYYYKSGAYISYDLTAVQSSPSLSQAFLAFADALWKAGFYIWVQVLFLVGRALSAPTSLLTLLLILIASLLFAFYFLRSDESSTRRSFAIQATLIGLIGILLGRIPSFAAGLPLTLQSSFDRFMISMMLGASLFIVGLVEFLPGQRAKAVTFACLIAFGIGQQFYNANIFRRDWSRQQQIYWQIAWRMPGLKPGTALVTQQMPLDYETDFSMTAALNWLYSPQQHPASLPYALVYSEKRLGGVALPGLRPDTPMHFPFRTVDFNGNTSDIVAIYVPPVGCLRVLDPALGDAETYSRYPDSLTGPIALSNPSRILINEPSPALPASPFGKEPAHTWCYFYEKAELARQAHNWQMIVNLGEQAARLGFTPQDAFEWLPFIEGYARTGGVEHATRLSQAAWEQDTKLHRGLCVLWQRLKKDGPVDAQAAASGLIAEFGCGPD